MTGLKLRNLVYLIDFLHHLLKFHILFGEVYIDYEIGPQLLQLIQRLLVELSVSALAFCEQLDRLGGGKLRGGRALILQQPHL